MSNLFEYRETYPDAPGFKNLTTSREAAEAIEPRAKTLRAVALRCIAAAPNGLTAHELALVMGEERGSVQPRTSELKIAGKIVDSGMRRRNPNGKNAIVWKLSGESH